MELYSRVLSEEFEWEKDGLSYADPILGPAVRIKVEWVKTAISKIKSSKAVMSLCIVAEILKASRETANYIVNEGMVPAD